MSFNCTAINLSMGSMKALSLICICMKLHGCIQLSLMLDNLGFKWQQMLDWKLQSAPIWCYMLIYALYAAICCNIHPSMLTYTFLCWPMPFYADICPSMLTYALLCWHMPFYADICPSMMTYALIYWHMPFYADICPYMLIYALLWWHMSFYADIWPFWLTYALLCWHMPLYTDICDDMLL